MHSDGGGGARCRGGGSGPPFTGSLDAEGPLRVCSLPRGLRPAGVRAQIGAPSLAWGQWPSLWRWVSVSLLSQDTPCLAFQRGARVLAEAGGWALLRGDGGQPAGTPGQRPSFTPPAFVDTCSRPTPLLGPGDLEVTLSRLRLSRSHTASGHRPGLFPCLPLKAGPGRRRGCGDMESTSLPSFLSALSRVGMKALQQIVAESPPGLSVLGRDPH